VRLQRRLESARRPSSAEAGLPDFGKLIVVFVPANTPKPIVDKLEA
jgi:tripartite-type tricarboxylate transporter receptor subunit TctC